MSRGGPVGHGQDRGGPPDSQRIRAYYDDLAVHLVKDRIQPSPRMIWIFRRLDRLLSSRRFASALDLGCGIGVIAERLRRRVPSVVAVDLSDRNVRFAAATVRGVTFLQGDLVDLDRVPGLPAAVDLVTLFDVLEHVPRELHGRVLGQIARRTHDRTLVAVTIPDAGYLDDCRVRRPELLQIVDESITLDDLSAHAREAGLEIVHYERYGIDCEDQYRFFLLGRIPSSFPLTPAPPIAPPWTRLWWRIRSRLMRLWYARQLRAIRRGDAPR